MTDFKKAFAKIQGIKVTILDLETKMTTEYDSWRRAGEAIGCSPPDCHFKPGWEITIR